MVERKACGHIVVVLFFQEITNDINITFSILGSFLYALG